MTCYYCDGAHREDVHFEVTPATPAAWPWMRESFLFQLRGMDGGPRECASQQVQALHRVLSLGSGRAVVCVPRGHRDDFIGWSVELGGALLFAYVREEFRRKGRGNQMLSELPLRLPLVTAYWTDAAEAMSTGGFPISYDIHAYRALLAFVRGRDPRQPQHERAA